MSGGGFRWSMFWMGGVMSFRLEKKHREPDDINRDQIGIQVRTETSPEDVGGMHAAAGILTARGGMPSDSAIVARGWGKCCVSGCSSIRVNETEKVVTIEDKMLYEGDLLSLNGSTGEVILSKQPLSPPALSPDLETFMSWVDEVRQLKDT
ncbi:hypothetical protein ACQ4PT_024736 [Festuca glaucescens]